MADDQEPRSPFKQGPAEQASDELTGLYANKAYVASGPMMTRIVFGETNPTRINYHTAIVMPAPDAYSMAVAVLRILEDAGFKAPRTMAIDVSASLEKSNG